MSRQLFSKEKDPLHWGWDTHSGDEGVVFSIYRGGHRVASLSPDQAIILASDLLIAAVRGLGNERT